MNVREHFHAPRPGERHLAITDRPDPAHFTDPADVFLDTEGVAERYGIGITKAKELVQTPGFPASVVPGMRRYPLAALQEWERATSLAGTPADPVLQGERVTVVTPPPPGQPGRPNRRTAA